MVTITSGRITQNVAIGGTAQALLDIANVGTEDLTFDISIGYPTDAAGPDVVIDPEVYATALAERLAKEGYAGNAEAVEGFVPGPVQYSDDPYDLQFEYACADATGEAGIECDGNYLYTTKWNGDLFFRYGMD